MKKLLLGAALAAFGTVASADVIGSVDTTFNLLSANDKVVIERFDDPKVENASCYVSYAQTGGIAGWIGIAEDPAALVLLAVPLVRFVCWMMWELNLKKCSAVIPVSCSRKCG